MKKTYVFDPPKKDPWADKPPLCMELLRSLAKQNEQQKETKMSIENSLEAIENKLDRTATALEAIAEMLQGHLNQPVTGKVPVSSGPLMSEPQATAKRGRPAKDAVATTTPVAGPGPVAINQPAPHGPVSLDDLKEALRQVIKNKNPETAKAVLAKFGVDRVTAVAPEKFADLKKAFEDAAGA